MQGGFFPESRLSVSVCLFCRVSSFHLPHNSSAGLGRGLSLMLAMRKPQIHEAEFLLSSSRTVVLDCTDCCSGLVSEGFLSVVMESL